MRIQSTARPGNRAVSSGVDLGKADGPDAGHGAVSGGSVDPRVVAAYQPDHPDAERAREIRANLLAQWHQGQEREQRAVALATLDDGSELGEIAANLAVSFAQLGRRTLLVDADFHAPVQHMLMGVGNQFGLADALEQEQASGDAALATPVVNLSLLPAGNVDARSEDALERRPILQRIESAAHRNEIIITSIYGRAVQGLAVTLSHFDCVVPVARRGRTQMRDLKALIDALAARGVPTCGVVLSR